jgi:hypothetical protein
MQFVQRAQEVAGGVVSLTIYSMEPENVQVAAVKAIS